MKTQKILAVAAFGAMTAFGFHANAQETVVVEEGVFAVEQQPCKTHYYSDSKSNWFIQLGAGINSPFMENTTPEGKVGKHKLTPTYTVGFGKWISPYIGWRASFLGGTWKWNYEQANKNNYVNANVDFMWDMFNSFHGVNSRRVFSIIPYVGLGGTYTWDYTHGASQIARKGGGTKTNSWTLPVSAGLQMRFRLSKYVDFFAEGRASFYGDNANLVAVGRPVDIDITAVGGFSFNIGGADFKSYDPCAYTNYIANLNNQVNDLRGALATTTAALAVAESQLPCPEVEVTEATVIEAPAPLMATVRFTINSAKISNEEMVNVYNVAEWMKANPEQNVAICGYADKNTGTAQYNMGLSKRRAEAVRNALVNKYGINPDRLSISAEGSEVQPYDVNNWNRIVIFNNEVQ